MFRTLFQSQFVDDVGRRPGVLCFAAGERVDLKSAPGSSHVFLFQISQERAAGFVIRKHTQREIASDDRVLFQMQNILSKNSTPGSLIPFHSPNPDV